MSKHLWEVEHNYYCNEANYYSNDCGHEFDSWRDFMADMGDADEDMNLLFRWDWTEKTYDEEGEEMPPFNGDTSQKNGKLSLFYMQQRKGRYIYCTVAVCRDDEPAVIEFLRPKLAYLLALWAPLQGA